MKWWRWIRQIVLVPADEARLARAVWSLAALVSLAVAVWVALQPGRMSDFHEVRAWLDDWGFGARNPYTNLDIRPDYPPSALLVLAPIGLLPAASAHIWFIALNVVLTGLAVMAFARWAGPRMGLGLNETQVLALGAMMLATSMVRSSLWWGQTMSIALLFGVGAVRWARTRPAIAAVCLAVAACKPQVAIGFGLGIALAHGMAVPIGGAALSGLCFVAFGATVAEWPHALAAQYFPRLFGLYSAGPLRSGTSLRESFELISSEEASVVLLAALALMALVWMMWIARRVRQLPFGHVARTYLVLAALLWSLLFLPHQPYGMLLAVPVWWILMSPSPHVPLGPRARAWLAAGMVVLGVVGVPSAIRPDRLRSNAPAHRFGDTVWAVVADQTPRLILVGGFLLVMRMVVRSARKRG